MPATAIDSKIFGNLFSTSAMREVWSDESRTRKYLEGKKLWSDSKQKDLEARAKKFVDEVVKRAEGIEAPKFEDIFDSTFATLDDELMRQRATKRTSSLGQQPEQERLTR